MPQKNNFYAIRHKPTGFFLPSINSRSGSTQVSPREGCVPRLFTTEIHARKTLQIWLKGAWKFKESYDTACLNSHTYPFVKVVEKRPERKLEEMEIIQVQVIEELF